MSNDSNPLDPTRNLHFRGYNQMELNLYSQKRAVAAAQATIANPTSLIDQLFGDHSSDKQAPWNFSDINDNYHPSASVDSESVSLHYLERRPGVDNTQDHDRPLPVDDLSHTTSEQATYTYTQATAQPIPIILAYCVNSSGHIFPVKGPPLTNSPSTLEISGVYSKLYFLGFLMLADTKPFFVSSNALFYSDFILYMLTHVSRPIK